MWGRLGVGVVRSGVFGGLGFGMAYLFPGGVGRGGLTGLGWAGLVGPWGGTAGFLGCSVGTGFDGGGLAIRITSFPAASAADPAADSLAAAAGYPASAEPAWDSSAPVAVTVAVTAATACVASLLLLQRVRIDAYSMAPSVDRIKPGF